MATRGIRAMAAIAANELNDVGCTNAAVLVGGTQGRIDAREPTALFLNE